jgi:hypothetical protein
MQKEVVGGVMDNLGKRRVKLKTVLVTNLPLYQNMQYRIWVTVSGLTETVCVDYTYVCNTVTW